MKFCPCIIVVALKVIAIQQIGNGEQCWKVDGATTDNSKRSAATNLEANKNDKRLLAFSENGIGKRVSRVKLNLNEHHEGLDSPEIMPLTKFLSGGNHKNVFVISSHTGDEVKGSKRALQVWNDGWGKRGSLTNSKDRVKGSKRALQVWNDGWGKRGILTTSKDPATTKKLKQFKIYPLGKRGLSLISSSGFGLGKRNELTFNIDGMRQKNKNNLIFDKCSMGRKNIFLYDVYDADKQTNPFDIFSMGKRDSVQLGSSGLGNRRDTGLLSLAGFGVGKRGPKLPFDVFGFGKRREKMPFDVFGFGKRGEKLPFDVFGFGKRGPKMPFDVFGFGKRGQKLPFDVFGCGKRGPKIPFDVFGFGKRDPKMPFDVFGFGKRGNKNLISFAAWKGKRTDVGKLSTALYKLGKRGRLTTASDEKSQPYSLPFDIFGMGKREPQGYIMLIKSPKLNDGEEIDTVMPYASSMMQEKQPIIAKKLDSSGMNRLRFGKRMGQKLMYLKHNDYGLDSLRKMKKLE